ncbi:GH1 family beta-glucosidase [Fodinicola acaciae]|uniref:GH1 family beta-glucosidase n=1 Tax=Fodinicola acaciae TaxID=2681555 RepID=UPI001FEB3E7F|nr:GH1 family beta-glucosidase [Fodinicola acaciae]
MRALRLPAGFEWGISTSAFQIEGASAADGRTPSVWDTFCAQPGRIAGGDRPDPGCDHYHRWKDDVDLLAGLGVDSYRFSVSWSRVLAGGRAANPRGFAFYDRLVDALLAAGIEPVVNLFHWDLPQDLQDAGGWRSRDTAYVFAEYAEKLATALADRVTRWSTMNEPFEHFGLGHVLGFHAPGQNLTGVAAFSVAHHLLLAHGLGVRAVRAGGARQVGLINSYAPVRPVNGGGDGAAACALDAIQNRLFTDPVLLGEYPAGLDAFEMDPASKPVRSGDLEIIAAPLDFLGVNYYNVLAVSAPEPADPLPFRLAELPGFDRTASGWPVVPDGMRETLVMLKDRYRDALPPLYVTETGAAYDEKPDADGFCDDFERVAFLASHVEAIAEAVASGVDVRGAMLWSLLDNFEWAEGFSQRFGLVHVDFQTAQRTPKASYYWYRDLIRGVTP